MDIYSSDIKDIIQQVHKSIEPFLSSKDFLGKDFFLGEFDGDLNDRFSKQYGDIIFTIFFSYSDTKGVINISPTLVIKHSRISKIYYRVSESYKLVDLKNGIKPEDVDVSGLVLNFGILRDLTKKYQSQELISFTINDNNDINEFVKFVSQFYMDYIEPLFLKLSLENFADFIDNFIKYEVFSPDDMPDLYLRYFIVVSIVHWKNTKGNWLKDYKNKFGNSKIGTGILFKKAFKNLEKLMRKGPYYLKQGNIEKELIKTIIYKEIRNIKYYLFHDEFWHEIKHSEHPGLSDIRGEQLAKMRKHQMIWWIILKIKYGRFMDYN
jgi:hypothetical protein